MLALMLQHEDSRMGQNPWNKEKCNSVKSKKSTLPYINADCIVLANIVQAYTNMQSHFWGWSPNNDQWLLVLTKKKNRKMQEILSLTPSDLKPPLSFGSWRESKVVQNLQHLHCSIWIISKHKSQQRAPKGRFLPQSVKVTLTYYAKGKRLIISTGTFGLWNRKWTNLEERVWKVYKRTSA